MGRSNTVPPAEAAVDRSDRGSPLIDEFPKVVAISPGNQKLVKEAVQMLEERLENAHSDVPHTPTPDFLVCKIPDGDDVMENVRRKISAAVGCVSHAFTLLSQRSPKLKAP